MIAPHLFPHNTHSWVMQGVTSSVLQQYLHRLESRKCQVIVSGSHHTHL